MEKELKIQIDEYINGELTGATLAAFEDQLKTDKTLQANVNWQQKIHNMLLKNKAHQKETVELPAFMDELANEYIVQAAADVKEVIEDNIVAVEKETKDKSEMPENPKQPSLIKWLIPVSTLAAAAILLFMFFPSGEVDLSSYSENYYQAYEVSFTVKGESDSLADAEKFYNNKQWAAARDLFIKYPENNKAQIAKANCEYQLQKYDDAIATLKPIASANNDYSETASWYLALTYLQKKNKAEAFANLKNITTENRFYSKAQKLIKQLD